MTVIHGELHSVEYLETVMAMHRLLKMNNKIKVFGIHLDSDERCVSFRIKEAGAP